MGILDRIRYYLERRYKLERYTTKKEPEIKGFREGDRVILLGVNPFKGTLRGKKPYAVKYSHYGWIGIRGENNTVGTFRDTHFTYYDSNIETMEDAALEYEDIMAAQKLTEGNGHEDECTAGNADQEQIDRNHREFA